MLRVGGEDAHGPDYYVHLYWLTTSTPLGRSSPAHDARGEAKALLEIAAEQPRVAIPAGQGDRPDRAAPVALLQGLLQWLLADPLTRRPAQSLAEGVLQGLARPHT